MDRHEVAFGRFRLDLGQRELSHDGTTIRLGARALDILCILALARGEVVSKDELMARVWPGRIVEENNIQVHVSALRRALHDNSGGQNLVATVPGRGYRLLGLQASFPAEQSETERHSDLAVSDKPSIAVLPFQNMSGDPEREYFADGIVQDIITGLSRIKWLSVIARNSSSIYKTREVDVRQVERELSIHYVLEGSVRKTGNRVRITAQLIDARSGVHLWAERYDGLLDDIFAVQDEIAMSVIGAIEPNLRKAEIERVKRKRPDSLAAYDLLLRSLPSIYDMMPEGAGAAIPLLTQALKLEPEYAGAHAFLAWCFHFRYSRGGLREEDRAAAIQHARAAVTGGGDDATALAIAGLVFWLDEHDPIAAFDLFDRALAISNSNVVALCCSAAALAWMGKPELAIERAQCALRLSPFDSLNALSNIALAVAYFQTNRYEKARDAARRAVESNPRYSVPYSLLAAALVRLGCKGEADTAARLALSLDPTLTIHTRSLTVGLEPAVFGPLAAAWREVGIPD